MVFVGDEAATSNRLEILGENNKGTKTPLFALIVDDDPFLCKLHSFMLKSVGLTFQIAKNGKEAVDIFRSGANFDIVFMDLEMPIMNGIKATKEIRGMGVTCKIVGVTACEVPAKNEAFIQAGLNFLYEKPLNVAKIRSCLEA